MEGVFIKKLNFNLIRRKRDEITCFYAIKNNLNIVKVRSQPLFLAFELDYFYMFLTQCQTQTLFLVKTYEPCALCSLRAFYQKFDFKPKQ